ncbi:MAG: chemotaxis protein CheW [Treponema sp.]|nr:chemotaxis protein CheW [Treponema sp.]
MSELSGRSGEYLCFYLGRELYAVNVSRVEVVLEMQSVTRVPRAAPHMRGVINHRGSVVPVVDLRMRFGMGLSELSEGTNIIILQLDYDGELLTVGMLADGVREVINLDPGDTEKPPRLGSRLDEAVIEGIAKRGDEFIILLDIDEVFRAELPGTVSQTASVR